MRTGPRHILLANTALLVILQSCTCAKPLKSVSLDGSSTVYLISEAIAEEYQKEYKGRVSIGISGTGGGFKKLCAGRIKIAGASRQINESEQKLCEKNGIFPTEFPVGLDGIVVVVNPQNNWISEIDITLLKKLFEPAAENVVVKWSDLFVGGPERKMTIFAPGISSGTYDYFTKVIVGVEHASRGDLISSEDDNVLVHGVRSNLDSIGFFSFAHYSENRDDLKALAIIDPEGRAVLPTKESIQSGQYYPLSRPVFLYADQEHANEVERNFLRYYLENASNLAHEVGFVALAIPMLKASIEKFRKE